MRVYLALKHSRYPFGMDVKWTKAATVEAVFCDRRDAQLFVDYKNAKNSLSMWSVQQKAVREKS